MSYEITVDLDTCDGIFACLVRDDRFREADDGLVTLPDGERDDRRLSATFEDDRIGAAKDAAASCPLDAIEVTKL